MPFASFHCHSTLACRSGLSFLTVFLTPQGATKWLLDSYLLLLCTLARHVIFTPFVTSTCYFVMFSDSKRWNHKLLTLLVSCLSIVMYVQMYTFLLSQGYVTPSRLSTVKWSKIVKLIVHYTFTLSIKVIREMTLEKWTAPYTGDLVDHAPITNMLAINIFCSNSTNTDALCTHFEFDPSGVWSHEFRINSRTLLTLYIIAL